MATVTSSFSLAATIVPRSFTLSAWILGDRWKHHRMRDHFGAESDLTVVLSAPIGKYAQYTPIHYVLEDIFRRLSFLDDYERTQGSFSLNATFAVSGTYGQGFFRLNSVVKKTRPGSFTLNATFNHTRTFSLDAVLVGRFSLSAFIV